MPTVLLYDPADTEGVDNILLEGIQHKLALLDLAKEFGNVSKACKALGYNATLTIAIKPQLQGMAL